MKIKAVLVLFVVSAVGLFNAAYADNKADSVCGKHLNKRSVVEVLQDHLAAIAKGDAVLVACDYDPNAILIMPNTVIRGQDAIESFYVQTFSAAGGTIVVAPKSLTIADDIALAEYSISSPNVIVTDGVDTFVIDKGLITAHTVRFE